MTTSGGVQEYSPSGQLVRTVPGTSTATGSDGLCFDPSGRHLIVPGVGLFDNAGNALPSNWSSVTEGYRCVADGLGNVYVGTYGAFGPLIITKYDLRGNPIQTFHSTLQAIFDFGMDLAPDECTMLVGGYLPGSGNGQLNVCTGNQSGPAVWDEDVRVLPNWEVIEAHDYTAWLADASGAGIMVYGNALGGPIGDDFVRDVSLDPDGTSFWSCCWLSPNPYPPYTENVVRWDISSGRVMSEWPVGQFGLGFNAYGPPLLGDADVEGTVDSDNAGTAEAFETTVGYSGRLTRLHLYVDSSSTASQAVVGVYSNNHRRPGTLEEQATISGLRSGSWNYVNVPAMPVAAGQHYWIAVLGPNGGGTLSLRDAGTGGQSKASAQPNLSALPSHWSGVAHQGADGPISAYGS